MILSGCVTDSAVAAFAAFAVLVVGPYFHRGAIPILPEASLPAEIEFIRGNRVRATD